MQVELTALDLAKIERWAMAYLEAMPHGVSYWDKHGNDSLTYRKVCKALRIEPRIS